MATDTAPTLAELPNGGWDARLRLFRAGDEVDTAAVVTRRYVVLVDTMATPALAAGIVAALAPDLRGRDLLVVNTHADWDHCWGNATFERPGGAHPAPIVGHALAAERLRGAAARAVLERKRGEEPRFAGVRLVPPTITFAGALRLDGGDLTMELVHTPGHTPDHVAVWIPELSLLLAGDAAEHPFPCVGGPATLGEQRESLRRLAALDPKTVIPCHGGTTDPALLLRNLDYFDAVERHARAALAAGGLPPDWREREDLPALVGLPFADAVRMTGADPAGVADLYRGFHLEAVRATLLALESDGAQPAW